MSDKLSVGERIRCWRNAYGFSLREFSKETGIQFTALWRIENGVQPTRDYEIEAVAKTLGIDMAAFYGPIPEAVATGDTAA